jgi:hypothetical protein
MNVSVNIVFWSYKNGWKCFVSSTHSINILFQLQNPVVNTSYISSESDSDQESTSISCNPTARVAPRPDPDPQ